MPRARCSVTPATKRRGAIPISLLNSQFHSSLGTLPPLPVAAQHANQVNALCLRLLPHAGNTVSITRASQLLREMTARHSSTSFCGKCKRDFTSTPTVAMHTGRCTQIFLCLLLDLCCSFRMLRVKNALPRPMVKVIATFGKCHGNLQLVKHTQIYIFFSFFRDGSKSRS